MQKKFVLLFAFQALTLAAQFDIDALLENSISQVQINPTSQMLHEGFVAFATRSYFDLLEVMLDSVVR